MTDTQATGSATSAAIPEITTAIKTPNADTLKVEAPKVEASKIEASKIDPILNGTLKEDAPNAGGDAASFADKARAKAKAMFDPARLKPGIRTKIAASIAAATIVGASLGAVGATGYAQWNVAPIPAPVAALDSNALKSLLTQISAEVATLKAGLDTNTRNAGVQLTKLSERMDRAEKAQAEPAARLARIGEAIERIEKRPSAPAATPAATFTTAAAPATPAIATIPAAAAPETTGSIVEKQQQRPPVVEGWILRDIYDGAALIEGRRGLVEVIPGTMLPGVGRVEQIKRVDGRWVVVTSRGLITSSR